MKNEFSLLPYMMYVGSLVFLGYAVRKLVEDAEHHAYELSETQLQEAWTSGYRRATRDTEQEDVLRQSKET